MKLFICKMTWRKLPIISVLLLIPYAGFWFWQAHAAGSDIARGKLGHTTRWGWINWGHAIPEAPRKLLAEIRLARPDAAGKITVSLGQNMSGNYGPLRATAGLTRTYRADFPPTPAQQTALAWALLRDTSEAFERMQEELPNSLDPSSWRSAWRDGDLAGNRVSFFAALHGLELNAVKGLAGAEAPEVSRARWKGKKVRSWERPEGFAHTALPDGRDPWDPAWETGAPSWEMSGEDRTTLQLNWR